METERSVMPTERTVVIRMENTCSFINTHACVSSFLIQSCRRLKNVHAACLDISKYEFSCVTFYVIQVDELWSEIVGEIPLRMLAPTVIL